MNPETKIPKHQLARSIVDASMPPHKSLPDFLDILQVSIQPFREEPLEPHDLDAIKRTQLPWDFVIEGAPNTQKKVIHATATRTLEARKDWRMIKGVDPGLTLRGLRSGMLAMATIDQLGVSDLGNIIVAERKLVGTPDEMPFDHYISSREELLPDRRIFAQNKEIILPAYSPDKSDLKLTDAQRYAINILSMYRHDAITRIGLDKETVRLHLAKVVKNNDISYSEMLRIAFTEGLIDTDEGILKPNIDWDLVSTEDHEFIRNNLFDTNATAPKICELVEVLGLKTRDQLYIASLRDGIAPALASDQDPEI